MTRLQLQTLGVANTTVTRWTDTGYLIRVLPRVYAVGHAAANEHARLISLVLFAGPGAALSHGTAAHWRGWLRYPVTLTHLSTTRRIRTPIPGVRFHQCGRVDRERIRGVPCTFVTQTLLDLAATEPAKLAHRALAQLDYERELHADSIRSACRRGQTGSVALRKALDSYIPQLARTKSDLEDEFLYLCQRHNLPLPQVNVVLHGKEVDAYWPDARLVVELDGQGNHGTASQRNRDERHSLTLRAQGLRVVRYTWAQVAHEPATVAADLSSVRAWIPRPLSTI